MQMSGRQVLEWRPSMKDPCISREQYKGIHDVVNDQGFDMRYTAISNRASHLEVFQENQYSKAKGSIDFFSYVECFRSKEILKWWVWTKPGLIAHSPWATL